MHQLAEVPLTQRPPVPWEGARNAAPMDEKSPSLVQEIAQLIYSPLSHGAEPARKKNLLCFPLRGCLAFI